jgi:uncharacterized membrane protein YgcG
MSSSGTTIIHSFTPKPLARMVALILALALGACGAARRPAADQQNDLPKPLGFVSDFAGKLSAGKKSEFEALLKNFADRGGIDLAVVTIPYAWLKDEAIEDYSLRLARQWGVGRGPQKLGLLLLVAIKEPDRDGAFHGDTRLEVSRNLERDMTNEQAAEIIGKMREDFLRGRFDQSLTVGVQLIVSTLAKKRGISAVQ